MDEKVFYVLEFCCFKCSSDDFRHLSPFPTNFPISSTVFLPNSKETFINPINYRKRSEAILIWVLWEKISTVANSFEINWKRMVIGKLQTETREERRRRREKSFTQMTLFICAGAMCVDDSWRDKRCILLMISSLICRMEHKNYDSFGSN
jgi:hypothetical protein